MFKFTYFLKLTCDPQINTRWTFIPFPDCSELQNIGVAQMYLFSAEIGLGEYLFVELSQHQAVEARALRPVGEGLNPNSGTC